MQKSPIESAINKLNVSVFLRDFSVEQEALKTIGEVPDLSLAEVERLLQLVRLTKESEKAFFVGPIIHPLGKHHEFANVPTIELSNKCYRLEEWIEFLSEKFPELGPHVAERLISRYVYLRHLR